MHTIGCPATSFFLPKLKKALVWTTDPLPPAVRSGVRDLEACLRWEKREKTEGERERVSVFVRVDARKYKTYLLEFVFVQLFLHVIAFVSRAKCDPRFWRRARPSTHTQKKRSATWLTHRKHIFLNQEVWLRDECAGSSHFYINSLFVMMCFEWGMCISDARISLGFCGSKRTKKKRRKEKRKKNTGTQQISSHSPLPSSSRHTFP